MDIEKLYEKVIADREVKDIPLAYVMTVLNCVLEAIGSGECFYSMEDE